MTENQEIYDSIIIGGGPAGYAGAIYAARFMLNTVVIAKEKGGLLVNTHIVENYPGIVSITGWDLMDQFEKHVKDYDVPVIQDEVIQVEKIDGNLFVSTTKSGKKYTSKTILLATGNKRRLLDVPGEKELFNKGVSYCATCDAPLFKGKVCGMVGGGDSAVKEALILAEHAAKVYIIYRGEEVRPEPINKKRMEAKDNIEVINNTNVLEFVGSPALQYAKLDKPFNGSDQLELQGCFIEIGWLPQNELAKQLGVALNKRGEVIGDEESKTNVPGVFAAGDLRDTHFKQAIVSASEGSIAADSIHTYVKEHFE